MNNEITIETKTTQADLLKQVRRKEANVARKRQKLLEGKEHIERVLIQAAESKVIVAIDMSLRSPGMCIIDRTHHRCQLISAQRLKEHGGESFHKNLLVERDMKMKDGTVLRTTIDLLDFDMSDAENEEKSVESMRQFDNVTNRLYAYLKSYKREDLYVVLEGYSFSSQRSFAGSASITGLAEVTGLMKYRLFADRIAFDVVPPTTIKKWFAKGGANKFEMFQVFHRIQTGIDLETLIPRRNNKSSEIPSPQQDLIDAFASGYSLFCAKRILSLEREKLKTTKPKKRKAKASDNATEEGPHQSPTKKRKRNVEKEQKATLASQV